jgi:hypothetical protein
MSDVDMREDNREEPVEAAEAVVPVNKNKRFRKEKRTSNRPDQHVELGSEAVRQLVSRVLITLDLPLLLFTAWDTDDIDQ